MSVTSSRLKGLAAMLALAAAVALGTAGCTTATSTPQSTSIASETPTPSIYCGDDCTAQLELAADPASVTCDVGVSWSATSFPYGAVSSQQIPDLAKKWFPGMSVTVTDGQGDAAIQSGQVDEMVAQGIDVLIISPRDSDALAGAVDRAVAAGVKVIAADRDVNTTVDTYIGSDNVEAGVVSGKNIAAVLGDGGQLIELAGSLGASPTIARGDGLRTGLEGSGVTIVDSQTADYDQAKGLTVMQDLLQKYPAGTIDGVYTHNDQMAFGAIQAIKEAGREGEIQVFSIDGEDKALEYIQSGEMQSTVGYPLVTKESVIAAAKLCSGEPIDERIVLDSTLIDASNVADYVGKSPQTE